MIKEKKQAENWKVEVNDEKKYSIYICVMSLSRWNTHVYDKKGNPRYPLDEFLGFRKRQKQNRL